MVQRLTGRSAVEILRLGIQHTWETLQKDVHPELQPAKKVALTSRSSSRERKETFMNTGGGVGMTTSNHCHCPSHDRSHFYHYLHHQGFIVTGFPSSLSSSFLPFFIFFIFFVFFVFFFYSVYPGRFILIFLLKLSQRMFSLCYPWRYLSCTRGCIPRGIAGAQQ